jgi:hypothetical protein
MAATLITVVGDIGRTAFRKLLHGLLIAVENSAIREQFAPLR